MELASVKEEYNKHKELNVEHVKTLEEWVKKQPHLPQITELHYIHFLHSCHWSLEHAKSTIDKFFTYRTVCPELFKIKNPFDPKVKIVTDIMIFAFLPKIMPEDYRILFIKLMDPSILDFTSKEAIKVFDMCLILDLMQNGTSEGLVIIVDFEGATASHVLKINVTDVRNTLSYLQEALPVRIKSMYFINMSPVVEIIPSIIKPFLKNELLNQLHFMGAPEKLFQFVPQKYLPQDYGGNAPSTNELQKNMQKLLVDNAEFFQNDEKLASDESQRHQRPSYIDNVFGIGAEGSFKKLEFD